MVITYFYHTAFGRSSWQALGCTGRRHEISFLGCISETLRYKMLILGRDIGRRV